MKFNRNEGLTNDHLNTNRLRLEELTELFLEGYCEVTKGGIKQFIRKHRKLQAIALSDTHVSVDRRTFAKFAKVCQNQNRKIIMKWCGHVPDENEEERVRDRR